MKNSYVPFSQSVVYVHRKMDLRQGNLPFYWRVGMGWGAGLNVTLFSLPCTTPGEKCSKLYVQH